MKKMADSRHYPIRNMSHTSKSQMKVSSKLILAAVALAILFMVGYVAFPGYIKPEANNETPDESPTPTTTEGTATDIDGNVYKTIKIGNQVWMAENLKTTRLNDGTSIPNLTDDSAWDQATGVGYCWYNNDASNKATHGAIYNWYAANSGKLAPRGWHVPSKDEWLKLINYLGGEDVAGGKLKEVGTSHWLSPNLGATDEVGFKALPSGYRGGGGTFFHMSDACFWWSSTKESDVKAWRFSVNYSGGEVDVDSQYFTHGWSIRCIKDN